MRRRAAWAAACAALALVLCWASGGFAWVLHQWMARALAARDYEAADDALGWVRRLRVETPHTSYWEARLRRKQLRIADVPELLQAAARGGVDADLIRREAVLLRAQTGDLGPVRQELNLLLSRAGEDGPEICEAYVNGCFIAGEFDLATTILAHWQADYPRDPQPHYARGRYFEFLGRTQEGVDEFQSALEKEPEHWPARYNLGRALLALGRAEEALNALAPSARMRNNAAPEWRRAQALRALGRNDECRAILEELVRRRDEDIRASFVRVGEPERGRPIELELGAFLVSAGEHSAALSWLDRALEAEPRNLEARWARGLALRGLGRDEEAASEMADVERVRLLLKETDHLVDEVMQHPEEPHVEECTQIGATYLKHAEARKGEFWLRTALNRDATYAPAHALLADYYAELARTEPAYQHLAERHRLAAGATSR